MNDFIVKEKTVYSRMHTVGRALLITMSVLFIAACASNKSLYVPAPDEGDVGYRESRLSEARYRVVFKGESGTSLEKVQDYALLRAAELTVAQNYDWFEVAERTTTPLNDKSNAARAAVQVSAGTTQQTSCGLLGCTTTSSPSTPGFPRSELEFSEREQSYITSIEVLMGEGTHDRSADIYDARDVITSVRARF